VDIAINRVHLGARSDPLPEVLAGVGERHRGGDPVEPCTLHQVLDNRVEQPTPRAEDQVDGGAGHPGRARDLVHARRLGGRRAQPLIDRVEDAPAGLLRRLGAQPLLVLPRRHGRPSYIQLTSCLTKDRLSDECVPRRS
jgi:hypothetical protein